MRASLSSIVALAEANSSANSAQLAFDSGVEAFSAEATNFVNCAAMGVGSLAFSSVRLAASAALSRQLVPGKAALTWMAGVFGEVAAFRSVSQLAENHLHQQASALAAQGFFQTLLDISLIKIAGHAVRSDHFFVRHSTSALGMVAGGYASQALDLSPKNEQNFAQRFSHAFAASLAMETGACLSRVGLGGRLEVLQRRLQVGHEFQAYDRLETREKSRTPALAAEHAGQEVNASNRLQWLSYPGWKAGSPLPRIVLMVGNDMHAAHCLEAFLRARQLGVQGGFPIGEVRILSNAKPSERVERLLREHGLTENYRWKSAGELGRPRDEHFDWIADEWQAFNPDFVVMAKYMFVLPPNLIRKMEMNILNMHHGNIPGLEGRVPVAAAVQLGASIAAVSFHFAIPDLDRGDLIHQVSFPIGKESPLYGTGDVESVVYGMVVPIVQEAEVACLLMGLNLFLNGRLAMVRNHGYGRLAEGRIEPSLLRKRRVAHLAEPQVDFARLGYDFPLIAAAYARHLRNLGILGRLGPVNSNVHVREQMGVDADWDAREAGNSVELAERLEPQPDGGEEAIQPAEEAPHVPSFSAEPVRVEATDTEVLVGSPADAEPEREGADLIM